MSMADKDELPQDLYVAAYSDSAAAEAAWNSLKRLAADDVIEVTGSAKRPIRYDAAVWRLSVTAEGATLQEASANLAAPTQRVLTFFRENAVPDSVLTMGVLQPEAQYRILENGTTTGEVSPPRRKMPASWRCSPSSTSLAASGASSPSTTSRSTSPTVRSSA